MRRCFRFTLIWLFAASLQALAQAQDGATLEFLGEFRWRSDVEKFGGFSGLELSDDGGQFWAVSDGGLFAHGRLERSAGTISGISGISFEDLKSPSGQVLQGVWNDAEGLVMQDDGQAFVSFEGEHRVWRYEQPGGNAVPIQPHPDFSEMQNNSSLEVLAIDPMGRLITLPERSGILTRPFPVYRLGIDGWSRPFGIRRASPFLPVGGDFGPDGKFYLLERHFSGLLGFQTRIRRFELGETRVRNEETLLVTGPGTHDNLEGISLWRDAAGAIRITLISDDNYRAFQRTEFVEYRLLE